MDLINLAIAIIPSVMSGVVLIYVRKANEKSDKREKLRIRENILILENIDAIGELATQTARCVRGEKINGELVLAIEYRQKKKCDLETHLREISAEMRR